MKKGDYIMAIFDMKYLEEAASNSKKLKGVDIEIDGKSEKIDIAISLCNKNWAKIENEAANDWFKRIEKCGGYEEFKDVYPTAESVKKHMTLDTVRYSSEGHSSCPVCGSMDLSFDVDPEIDPNHFYVLYVDFDKNNNVRFDSQFDG